LQQLREQLDEADESGDDKRGFRIQAEMDALTAELQRALGLNGRDHRAGSVVERGRLRVTRALRTAITRAAAAELGACLNRSMRTRIHWLRPVR
jgi:hypothetical protein